MLEPAKVHAAAGAALLNVIDDVLQRRFHYLIPLNEILNVFCERPDLRKHFVFVALAGHGPLRFLLDHLCR